MEVAAALAATEVVAALAAVEVAALAPLAEDLVEDLARVVASSEVVSMGDSLLVTASFPAAALVPVTVSFRARDSFMATATDPVAATNPVAATFPVAATNMAMATNTAMVTNTAMATNTARDATAAASDSSPSAGVGIGITRTDMTTDMTTDITTRTRPTTTLPITPTRRLRATMTGSFKARMTPPTAGLQIQTETSDSRTLGTLSTATHTCKATPRATAGRLQVPAKHRIALRRQVTLSPRLVIDQSGLESGVLVGVLWLDLQATVVAQHVVAQGRP